MRITGINAATFGEADARARQDAPGPEPRPESRALVVAAPQPVTEDRPMAYRNAPFLAHLIATKEQLPQTRSRRRAEPDEALAAYRSVAKLVA